MILDLILGGRKNAVLLEFLEGFVGVFDEVILLLTGGEVLNDPQKPLAIGGVNSLCASRRGAE